MKKLVAYFSATGTTKKVADKIAKVMGADIFEIEPKFKYSKSDLDWTDENSRSSREMKDKSSRPEITKKVENISDYDAVILGFPVWWYTAPTIINTFLEENDLTNKQMYVFVTSGSSGVESTLANLRQAYPKLNIKKGSRLTINDSDGELVNWIK
ncbi:MAG: NAD(P)H-dependent oxidoreductase [Clostridia bacterium]|nr:NAD(P)H-dependent oxidoreductase [Clostridia bacterium]